MNPHDLTREEYLAQFEGPFTARVLRQSGLGFKYVYEVRDSKGRMVAMKSGFTTTENAWTAVGELNLDLADG